MVERGGFLIVLSWTLTGIATVITALRFWVRTCWLRRVRADDYFMLLALVSNPLALVSTALVTNVRGMLTLNSLQEWHISLFLP